MCCLTDFSVNWSCDRLAKMCISRTGLWQFHRIFLPFLFRITWAYTVPAKNEWLKAQRTRIRIFLWEGVLILFWYFYVLNAKSCIDIKYLFFSIACCVKFSFSFRHPSFESYATSTSVKTARWTISVDAISNDNSR